MVHTRLVHLFWVFNYLFVLNNYCLCWYQIKIVPFLDVLVQEYLQTKSHFVNEDF